MSRDWNVSILSPLVTGQLGYAYALSGRVAEGLELLDQAMKAQEAIALTAFHSKVIVQVGEVCMLADRPEECARVRWTCPDPDPRPGRTQLGGMGAPPPGRYHGPPRFP